MFQYQKPGSDLFPPHLAHIPTKQNVPLYDIFNLAALADSTVLIDNLIPYKWLDWSVHDLKSKVTDALKDPGSTFRALDADSFDNPNIGDRPDWFTDAVFSQQQFVGPNPTTITLATPRWISQFTQEAEKQGRNDVLQLITSSDITALYVQDYSYFRSAAGATPDGPLQSDDGKRIGCASVALFHLSNQGALHPVAIVLDYKGRMDASVTIFNRRTDPTDSTVNEQLDWPWRFAKLCAQSSDWARHEITIHLVNAHLVEEVVIVAAQRMLPSQHVVFRLLESHWLKTLSINAAARKVLVPQVIANIAGFSNKQLYAFMNDAYKSFNWTALYIPTDLNNRGFPVKDLDQPKYHNYPYARNIALMWNTLRKFVATVLQGTYRNDAQVAGDKDIAAFCAEMRSPTGGQMTSFPQVNKLDDLIDMVTMCIHIASPQHTAVNYLQEYYQAVVPNKPSSLSAALPQTLNQLQKYTIDNMLDALPIQYLDTWLLMTYLPHLLSVPVAEDQNLLTFAALAAENGGDDIAKAASVLHADLLDLATKFQQHSDDMDDQTKPYMVMDPTATATSILL